MILKLDLPLPPSKNRLHVPAWRWTTDSTGQQHRYQGWRDSPEYEAYKREVWAEVMRQALPEQRDGLSGKYLAINVALRFPSDGRREDMGDAANCIDALLDALAPALGIDDRQFWSGGWTRHEHANLSECTVHVWEIAAGSAIGQGRTKTGERSIALESTNTEE